MRTTHVGQLAAENLDDVRTRYEDFSKNVLKNMKVRENSLNVVRTRVDNLWSDIKKLVRVEVRCNYLFENKKKTIIIKVKISTRKLNKLNYKSNNFY